jgi:hypothetical protein
VGARQVPELQRRPHPAGVGTRFVVYRAVLSHADPERSLFLGVPTRVYDAVLSEPLGQLVAADVRLRVLVFDAQQQKVMQWIR